MLFPNPAINIKSVCVSRYLNMISHPETKPKISTLLLCGPDEHSLDELKLVCPGVLRSLKQLLIKPYILPGGGCFETIMTGILLETTKSNSNIYHGICTKGMKVL